MASPISVIFKVVVSDNQSRISYLFNTQRRAISFKAQLLWLIHI